MRKIVAVLSVLAVLGASGAAFGGAAVEDAVLCTAVVDRSPEGTASNFPPDVGRIFAFTKVMEMEAPGTVIHRWSHEGAVVAEVPLDVGGAYWRTWSSKAVLPEQTGNWEVEVLDGAGNVLATLGFTVGGAGKEKAPH